MISSTSMAARTGARQLLRRSTSVAPPSPNPIVLGRNHSINNARNLSTARTLAVPSARLRTPSTPVRQQRQGYATTTNPNPPLDKKNASNDVPSRIALIGARGYTGQALIDLFEAHPYMDLRHVSSRELAGKELERYTKRKVIYEHLTPEDAAQLDAKGEIDCWVMALPNGVCKPYVDAINESQKGKSGGSVIVDLSADYRFDQEWAYGLPELTKRSDIFPSTRISNPGCYATAAQLGIAPLVEHLAGEPVVFGVSGYSGAGTKPSPKNDVNLLKDNLIPYILACHSLFASPKRHVVAMGYDKKWGGGADDDAATVPFSGPRADFEAYQAEKENRAMLQAIQAQLSPTLMRSFRSPEDVAAEFLPYLVRLVSPDVKPVVVGGGGDQKGIASVRKDAEKAMVKRAAEIMVDVGITLQRGKIETDSAFNRTPQWVYRLEPDLDALAVYETATSMLSVQAPTRYAVRQVLDQELQASIARRENEARQARFQGGNPLGNDVPSTRVEKAAIEHKRLKVLALADRVRKDFFGRVIEEKPLQEGEGDGHGADRAAQDQPIRVWVSYNEGLNNAVRKPISLQELMRGM
ncbi:hypothetical protein BN1723_004795 [Verticillium longisporum]|uniref:Semialdehyde dehydrogenase NAD-binding domain-containing protein n=1 Tax=Verticillium longisporum TaxID=100787 RepID=A0A0G4N238_VERLO|nr:hypothetical protein BN1723_004795 [Verticillium longisporum]